MPELNDRTTPSLARNHLLAQHGRIRLLLVMATGEARLVLSGAHPEVDFAEAVNELVATLVSHNRAEEATLEPLLREADAWGAIRAERMFQSHAAEHAVFVEALSADGVDLRDLAGRMAEIAEDLDAHMEAEERSFLSPAVLRDDVISSLGLSS